MNRYDFTGKVAVVTGGANGMGRSVALAMAAAGASVIIADISVEAGLQAAQVITTAGGSARFVRTDVSSEADVRAMVAEAATGFGGLDYAVNAAGIEIEQTFLADCEVETFDRVIAVNLRSMFLCLKYEITAMLERGGGAIVNFASTNAFRPQMTQSGYNASKFGVVGLTKTAAIEYARSGIRVNGVAPGAIDTAMLRDAIEHRGADEAALVKRYSLFRRFGEADEVTKAVLWLCSDEASFTTGHTLPVDGGYLAQ
jgi:NAD(P)-dependent dehydrogenase (short-subunit alcohol dehydrogenase family)